MQQLFNINDKVFMYKNFIIKSEFLPFENNNRLIKFTICVYGDDMQDLHKKTHIHYSSAMCLNIFGVHVPDGAVFDMQQHTFIAPDFKSGFELALARIDKFVKNRQQLHYDYFYYYFLSLERVHRTNHLKLPYEIYESRTSLNDFMNVGIAYNWFEPGTYCDHTIELTDQFLQQFCREIALCNADIAHYENTQFSNAFNKCNIYKNTTVYKGVFLKKRYNSYSVINSAHVFPDLDSAMLAIDKLNLSSVLPDYLIAFYTNHLATTKLENVNQFNLKSLAPFNVYDNPYMCITQCDKDNYIENHIQVIKGEIHYQFSEKFVALYQQYINNRRFYELF